jgi:hypothetical protein
MDDDNSAVCARDNVCVKQKYQLCVKLAVGCDIPKTGIFQPLIQPVCTDPVLWPNEFCLIQMYIELIKLS